MKWMNLTALFAITLVVGAQALAQNVAAEEPPTTQPTLTDGEFPAPDGPIPFHATYWPQGAPGDDPVAGKVLLTLQRLDSATTFDEWASLHATASMPDIMAARAVSEKGFADRRAGVPQVRVLESRIVLMVRCGREADETIFAAVEDTIKIPAPPLPAGIPPPQPRTMRVVRPFRLEQGEYKLDGTQLGHPISKAIQSGNWETLKMSAPQAWRHD